MAVTYSTHPLGLFSVLLYQMSDLTNQKPSVPTSYDSL